MRTRRFPRAVLALSLITIACTGDDDDATPTTSSPAPAAGTKPAPTTTLVEPTAPPSTATTTVPPTTTTTAPPTPVERYVGWACNQLRTAGYATRKRIVRRAETRLESLGETGTPSDVFGHECPRALAWTQDGVNLERQRRQLSRSINADEFAALEFDCDNRRVSVQIVGRYDQPIGIHSTAWTQLAGSDTRYDNNNRPMVIWRVGPGQRKGVESSYYRSFATSFSCHASTAAFLADRSRADGSAPAGAGAATTGRDPRRWFPALVAAEHRAMRSDDLDLFWSVQDLRGVTSLDALRSGWAETRPKGRRAPSAVRVCTDTIQRSGKNHIAFFAVVEFAPRKAQAGDDPGKVRMYLQSGVFRRGRDSQWRRIGNPEFIDRVYSRAICGDAAAD